MANLFKPGGPIDKIVQLRLSEAYVLISERLRKAHNAGEATIPNPRTLASDIVADLETYSKTIVTTSTG